MVLLVHGLLCGADCWSGLISRLPPGAAARAPDLPGMGAAPLASGEASLPALAEWLRAELLRHPGPTAVVASSWGGAIALELAATAPPPNLAALALFAPVHPFWTPGLRQRLLLRPLLARLGAAVIARTQALGLQRFLEQMYGDPAHLPPERVAAYRARLCRPGLGRAVAAYGRHWRRDLRLLHRRLSAVRLPTLLVWGDCDRAVPVASAAPLQRALPGARLEILPGLGHLPFEESPARSAALLLPFLRQAAVLF